MSREAPVRELTSFVALFHKAHAKVSALQRLDDQIAALCVQHKRLQDEVRSIQSEIDDEFARALRYNQAPSKLPEALYEPARANGNGAPASASASASAAPSAPVPKTDADLVLPSPAAALPAPRGIALELPGEGRAETAPPAPEG